MKKPVKRFVGNKRSTGSSSASASKSAKKATNLTLDARAIAQGERFSEQHGKSLSQLVTDLLYALPTTEHQVVRESLLPVVQRLHGVASGGVADRASYRVHLQRKYGGA